MPLTTEQLAIVKADILADPVLSAFPLTSDGALAIAAIYNGQPAAAFVVWRTMVPIEEIIANGFVWTAVDTLSAGKARIWDWMREPGYINPSKANVRQGLQDAFGTTQPNIAKHLKRAASRIEKLLATGTGTVGNPGTMGFEGPVTYQDIEQARAS